MMMGVQTEFAQTAMSLARRYQRLNTYIESAFCLSKSRWAHCVRSSVTRHSFLGKATQIEKKFKLNSENSRPRAEIKAAKLVTISRAIHEANNVRNVSMHGTTLAMTDPTATYCKYFISFCSFIHSILLVYCSQSLLRDRVWPARWHGPLLFWTDYRSHMQYLPSRFAPFPREKYLLINQLSSTLVTHVRSISRSSYGITFVALFSSCLLHTLATAYFLLDLLLSDVVRCWQLTPS